MKRLRAAIVGAGLMGRWHAYYATRAGADVAAIVDRAPASAAAIRKRYAKAEVFGDLQQCLASCPIDVVHVCTGLDSHTPLAETALMAGKHVLVEKPMARTAAEVQKLIGIARDNKVRLAVVHQFPCQRGFQKLLKRIGRLGDLVQITYRTSSAGAVGRSDAERRDVLLQILPHPFSLFCSLLGNEISDLSWNVIRFNCDELTIAGERNGTQLLILISLSARPTCNELTVVGTCGTAHVDLFHGFYIIESGIVSRAAKILHPFAFGIKLLAAAGLNLARRMLRWEPAYPGLSELIRSFYQSITNGDPPSADEGANLLIATWIDSVQRCNQRDLMMNSPTAAQGRRSLA